MDSEHDWKRFVGLIKAADENREKPRTQEAIAYMFEVLRDYDYEDIRAAVARLSRESSFRIQPADIARVIGGTASDKSAVAWQMFKRAIYHHGSFDSVAFPDAAYHWAILRMGGWERVARELEQLDDREMNFREKDFRQLYERGLIVSSFDRINGKEQVPRYLRGECERTNREGGWSLDYTPIIDAETGRSLDREKIEALGGGERRDPSALAAGIAGALKA